MLTKRANVFLAMLVWVAILAAVQSMRDERKSHTALQSERVERVERVSKAAIWDTEKNFFLKQPAVQSVWGHTYKIYDFKDNQVDNIPIEKGFSQGWGQAVREKVAAMKQRPVPGLGGATFGDVAQAFADNQCPLWIVGGFVRDLIAGSDTNDVDCVALCDSTDVIRNLSEERDWPHSALTNYFNIGNNDGETEYLEGFLMKVVLSDAFAPEWSVNSLFWSFSQDYVIDPTGFGFLDALEKKLRPSVPPTEHLVGSYAIATPVPPVSDIPAAVEYISKLHFPPQATKNTEWGAWYQWSFSGISTSSLGGVGPRYPRYIKMLTRGWSAFSNNFRLFMANNLAMQAELEDGSCPLGVGDFTGKVLEPTCAIKPEAHRCKTGGLILHAGALFKEGKTEFLEQFLNVYMTELAHLSELGADQAAKSLSELTVDYSTSVALCPSPSTAEEQATHNFRTAEEQAKHIARTAFDLCKRDVKNNNIMQNNLMSTDWARGCAALTNQAARLGL
mmetsp:Transcript_110498/g.219694  ORF Transcript_110498/g.219694 Transcript_110498/m.219694 type:complete len:504 (+) Transcript_110498:44-1555(+)